MFLGIDRKETNKIAIIDDKNTKLTYGDLTERVTNFASNLKSRTVAFILCENCAGALVGYLSMIENNIVPLLLGKGIDRESLTNLERTYHPKYYFVPKNKVNDYSYIRRDEVFDYVLLETQNDPYPINDKLQLLMTTSGSTGSPKLVRYKDGNLEANAKNVAISFGWNEKERAICDLGMQYTMGLNVINTHLFVGATVLMTTYNLMSSDFWDFIKEQKGTNYTGVPFSYDILHRLHYERMDLDSIRTFSQGGGKLKAERFMEFAEYCSNTGRRFIATFGTTETSARMCMLDPKLATTKIGSIGRSIPEGEMYLVDPNGRRIDKPGVQGELCYKGPNVTMGYAECKEDLNNGDEWNGEYHTGDLAYRDEDGCYYITGRLKRFLKLLSHRVSLDECESIINEKFDVCSACTGSDQKMKIYIDKEIEQIEVINFVSEKLGLYKNLFEVVIIENLPRNDRGKIDYNKLKELEK